MVLHKPKHVQEQWKDLEFRGIAVDEGKPMWGHGSLFVPGTGQRKPGRELT